MTVNMAGGGPAMRGCGRFGQHLGGEALRHVELGTDRGQPGGERAARIVDRLHRAAVSLPLGARAGRR